MKSKVGYSIGEPYKTEPWFDDFGDTDELPKESATNSQVGGDHYKNRIDKILKKQFTYFKCK